MRGVVRKIVGIVIFSREAGIRRVLKVVYLGGCYGFGIVVL